jgi:hypothetical protein
MPAGEQKNKVEQCEFPQKEKRMWIKEINSLVVTQTRMKFAPIKSASWPTIFVL